MFFSIFIFYIFIFAKQFLIFKYVIYLSAVKLNNNSALRVNFINIELDNDIMTFTFWNRLRLSSTTLFKLSFESMFNHSLSSELIMRNEIFFSSVVKSFSSQWQFVYHRIRIKKNDIWKTTFRTCYEHFEYQIILFELINASTTFQIYINKTLRKLVDIICIIYLNNIFIFNKDLTNISVICNKFSNVSGISNSISTWRSAKLILKRSSF